MIFLNTRLWESLALPEK